MYEDIAISLVLARYIKFLTITALSVGKWSIQLFK